MAWHSLINLTTVHNVLFLRRNGERLNTWSNLIMAGNLFLTIVYLFLITYRYNNHQIVTRINPNCKISEVPFPAVSICNYNIVSFKRSRTIAGILTSRNITREDIDIFLRSLPNLKDSQRREKLREFVEIMEILKQHYFTVETIMEQVHQKCDDLVLYCTFNRKIKNCKEMFSLIKTCEGYCCTFNYAALNDGSIETLSNQDEDVEHYDDLAESKQTTNVIVTSQSGRGSGLAVLLNVEPDDYPIWSDVPYYGAKVLLSDPCDYPEATIVYKYLKTRASLDIKVQPVIFQADDELRTIKVEKRGCLFHDEVKLKHTNRYSMETCKTECQMRRFLRSCGCIPYKYPIEKNIRICEFKDLECLNKLRVEGLDWMSCKPACYMECRDKNYKITSDRMPLFADKYPPDIINNYNVSHLSALQVFYDKPTCNCYKQILLIDFVYFIATYGGVFSLSFGASLLTIIEIVYLIIFNLIKYWCKRRPLSFCWMSANGVP